MKKKDAKNNVKANAKYFYIKKTFILLMKIILCVQFIF